MFSAKIYVGMFIGKEGAHNKKHQSVKTASKIYLVSFNQKNCISTLLYIGLGTLCLNCAEKYAKT